MGGRLRKSSLSLEHKHPILLPKECFITKIIIQWCHRQVQHAGRTFTMNEIRDAGYWIINMNSAVKSMIWNCVKCRILRGRLATQKMADLPVDRMDTAPPFTYCGIDLFGPFTIQERRSMLKRYGVLFTCLSCRAVHLESCNTLETDSFIQALRRFIARRGNIRMIRSDNGTNFIGARRELAQNFAKMDHDKIKNYLINNNADWIAWKTNPPYASHMGGVWERQIRTARSILESLLMTHGHSLNDESFRTVLTEVEAVVNSRPNCRKHK